MLKSIALSALLLFLYASGGKGWILGCIALTPWMISQLPALSLRKTLLSGYLMSVAYTLAGFHWFGRAIGDYTGASPWLGLFLLLVFAPVFQPQIVVYSLVRWLSQRRFGQVLSTLSASAAWIACERLVPKMLGDSLGHGLYPAEHLRQLASFTGVAGLTFLLLIINAGLAQSWVNFRTRQASDMGSGNIWRPMVTALVLLLSFSAIGWLQLDNQRAEPNAPTLKVGLIQANLTHYEEMRREKGPYEAVRNILDTHYAMSYDAVERQKVDVVLWSETVYPTTFLHPKSQAGAELDQEIISIVQAARTPFVFGTYDRDALGEYNAAALVSPNKGPVGLYRKTRLFPLTEYLPRWLDWPLVRHALPWTGNWLAGDGARVFPLQLRDGREIPVLPLICLDDTDSQLAIDGARLGAQALLTLSNDSWFTAYPQGAALHQAVAAFRSVETGLPQFRVTTNGYSAVIDRHGNPIASSRLGEKTLVVGALPANARADTLLVRWGDWMGLVSAIFLALLAITALLPRRQFIDRLTDPHGHTQSRTEYWVYDIRPGTRWMAAGLRTFARLALLLLAINLLLDANLRSNVLAQMRLAGVFYLLPEVLAWSMLRFRKKRLVLQSGAMLLDDGKNSRTLTTNEIHSVRPWRLPLPHGGLLVRLNDGQLLRLAVDTPHVLMNALQQCRLIAAQQQTTPMLTRFMQAREIRLHTKLNHPLVKFALFPLLIALPAFRLHQHIAYGHTLGEYYTFGLKAYLTTLGLWWATWAIGVMASYAILRAAMEGIAAISTVVRPQTALDQRYLIERMGLLALYLGMPLWLAMRILGNL